MYVESEAKQKLGCSAVFYCFSWNCTFILEPLLLQVFDFNIMYEKLRRTVVAGQRETSQSDIQEISSWIRIHTTGRHVQ